MFRENELPGWCYSDGLGEACADFLMTRLVIIFLFLVGTHGATLAEVCLRLEAD